MPAFPHPLTLQEQALARNRWQARREMWSQSLFLFAMYAAVAALVLLLWLRVDAATRAGVVAMIGRHETGLALATLGVGIVATRRALYVDALQQLASAYSALPIWRETQARRDTRTRAQLVARGVGAVGVVLLLFCLRDAAEAWMLACSLFWSLLALTLATVFAPAPRRALAQLRQSSDTRARLASVPRWLTPLSATALPHLPQWWWQQAGQAWLRGRAASVLTIGLLLAPTEAAAILVPLTLLMLGALVSALDVAHRIAAQLSTTLAARPPRAGAIWRALWPLHLALTLAVVLLVVALLQLLQVAPITTAAVGLAVILVASLDLLLAIECRRAPQRLGIARAQVVLIGAALASGLPPLLPLFVVTLIWLLGSRVRKDAARA